MGIRDFLKSKPWLGWALSAVFLLAAGFMFFNNVGVKAPDNIERRSQTVTIRCTETGNEWEMNRGRFERLLLTLEGEIDPGKGIPSEFAEGRLTGVLVDTDDWDETVERINAMKKAYGSD